MIRAILLLASLATPAHASVASWYHARPVHGVRYTAAHKTAPMGSHLRVCRYHHGCVVATVTDRGPFVRGRTVDLNRAAARRLGISGVAEVEVAVMPGRR